MKLRVAEAAEDELVDGAAWYDEREVGLGDQFIEEYRDAILRIQASPGMYARLETTRSRRNLRRCFLKRFPYYVGYELFEDEIVVLAVAHTKRRPNYWIRRQG
ncbi:MAG TPA: type II toxin-antitoxin system RelE/ParE family toxin [Pirellulaceae bacterium]